MKVNQRLNHLNKLLADLKKAEAASDVNAYRNVFWGFYSALRSTWERAVEEVLFNQVVERLEKEVKTRSLDGVCVDTESVQAVFDGMTRTSGMIAAHDHAVAENTGLPSADEAGKDLETFNDFLAKQRAKNKAAEKLHAHLKK